MSTTLTVPENVARSVRAQRQMIDELDRVDLEEFRSAMQTWSVTDLSNAGTGLISFYTRLDETKTDVLKALAKVVVALRSHFRTTEGDVDWSGRSWDYRQTVSAMYEASGIPPDSESNIQASLRYHVGNLLREVVPAEQLESAGLLTKSPKERMTDVRAVTAAVLAATDVEVGKPPKPAEAVSRQVSALYTVADRLEHSPEAWAALSVRLLEQYEDRLEEVIAKLRTSLSVVQTVIDTKMKD
jgi:hypothetical protein